MIVCDTGPLVAAALADDDHHHACVELFTGLHLAGRELLVPATVAAEVGYLLAREAGAEVGYLLAREAGAEVEAMFLGAIADGDFRAVDLRPDDFRRAADLVRQYGDLPLGTTDATVIAHGEARPDRGGHVGSSALLGGPSAARRCALPASLTRIMMFVPAAGGQTAHCGVRPTSALRGGAMIESHDYPHAYPS